MDSKIKLELSKFIQNSEIKLREQNRSEDEIQSILQYLKLGFLYGFQICNEYYHESVHLISKEFNSLLAEINLNETGE